MITHTLACRHTSLDHTDSHGLLGATNSMNICDWTGQEEEEVDCLSDEDGVIYEDQEVYPPLRYRPHSSPAGDGGSTHTANSILQGQAVPGQA